jgi:hypothetical protein
MKNAKRKKILVFVDILRDLINFISEKIDYWNEQTGNTEDTTAEIVNRNE